MLKFVKIFLIFTILYHILVTVVCYGIFGGQYQEIFSLLRDGIWVLFTVIVIATHRKHCRAFLATRKYPLISFGVLLVFGIGISKLIGKGRNDIFIGIKYGLRYLFIFLSAARVGYSLAYQKQQKGMERFLNFVIYALVALVIIGFLRQGAKLLFPGFFTRIGYGPLNDFAYGVKPPLYYLTGYLGTLRRQGIFAGPNNYGYFLVVFLPIIVMMVNGKRGMENGIRHSERSEESSPRSFAIHSGGPRAFTRFTQLTILAIRIIAITLTLSRSALVGTMVVVIFLFRKWIRKHRKIFIGLFLLCILGLIGLSLLKGESTLAHITNKFSSLSYVINQPLGYGLGSSGPAIHHNGGILPENYFIQLMIDIGTVGFLIWIFCVSQLGAITKKVNNLQLTTNSTGIIFNIWKGLTIGWIALLVMGMFLHVFEDSMVNYLFFILRGMTTGYLSYSLKGVKIGLRDFWKKR